MKIKFLKDYLRQGKVKVVAKRGRTPIAFHAGTVIEAADDTAKKWIKAGIAQAVKP